MLIDKLLKKIIRLDYKPISFYILQNMHIWFHAFLRELHDTWLLNSLHYDAFLLLNNMGICPN